MAFSSEPEPVRSGFFLSPKFENYNDWYAICYLK